MEKSIYNKMVKRTVTYSLFMWIVLLLILSYFSVGVYSTYQEVELKKIDLKQLVNSLDKIKAKGITHKKFNTIFNSEIKETNRDANLENIVNIIEDSFYDLSFQNESGDFETFDKYIKFKTKEVEERLSSDDEKKMREIASTVLPLYSLYDVNFEGNEVMSDLKFINYIENIMQTFNLEYSGDIGVADIFPLETEDEKAKNKKTNKKVTEEELLANKIFYVPLSFNIKGGKKSIIDFLYYVEKAGNVNIESNKLEIYEDGFFKKGDKNHRKSDSILEGDTKSSKYNIYLHQMMDIESVSFKEYIYEKKDGDIDGEFIANLRRDVQGQEEYEIEIIIRFYVKGVSEYKVEQKYKEAVDSIISKKASIKNALKGLSGLAIKEKTPGVALLVKRLVSYQSVLAELEANIKTYNKLSSEQVYKDILKSIDILKILISDLRQAGTFTQEDYLNETVEDNIINKEELEIVEKDEVEE